jgi:hypothetical protein
LFLWSYQKSNIILSFLSIIAFSSERLLKRRGDKGSSATLPTPTKRTSSLKNVNSEIIETKLGNSEIAQNSIKQLSASNENILNNGHCSSGRIIARLNECPRSTYASRQSVFEDSESKNLPIKPVRNRRKSGNGNRTGNGSEVLPLLIQSHATVHHSGQTSRLFAEKSSESAPKGNVDEVDDHLTPSPDPTRPTKAPPSEKIEPIKDGHSKKMGNSEFSNIAPPAYNATPFLSPLNSKEATGDLTQNGLTNSKTGRSPNSTHKRQCSPNNNAFHRYKLIQCTKL